MCELFALNASSPASIEQTVESFVPQGGDEGPHDDGWGLVLYQGLDAAIYREPRAATRSPLLGVLRDHWRPSALVVGHLRQATQAESRHSNTHPFVRELGGRLHAFAHKGQLPGLKDDARFRFGHARPIGETDSEYAFCVLLERLESLWKGGTCPAIADRVKVIGECGDDLRAFGPLSFVYADGDALFAVGDRHDRGHEYLYMLEREGPSLGFVSIIASLPLSDEAWSPIPEGELQVFRQGRRIDRRSIVSSSA